MRPILIMLGTLIFVSPIKAASPADIVIFSYDRPMQLYALLESLEERVTGLGARHIVCRASNEQFKKAYDEVERTFPAYKLLWQPDDGGQFKELTIKALSQSPNKHVLFAVDDIIVTRTIDLTHCTKLLEDTNAHGFHLRLGTNLNYCYNGHCKESPPPLTQVAPDVYSWRLPLQTYQLRSDWLNPYTVDMTVYRKTEILDILLLLPYKNPTFMESYWNRFSRHAANRLALCYSKSHLINIPMNCVQTTIAAAHMKQYSTEELLKLFIQGKKLDIAPFKKLISHTVHIEIEPIFVDRAPLGANEKKGNRDVLDDIQEDILWTTNTTDCGS